MDTWGFELSQLISGFVSLLLKGYRSGQGQRKIQLGNVAQAELRGGRRQGRPRKANVREKEEKCILLCFLHLSAEPPCSPVPFVSGTADSIGLAIRGKIST